MRLNARTDYALRAVVELAAAGGSAERPVTAERLATAQGIPPKFLEAILVQLRRAGVVHAQRGPEGGYWLARPAAEISLADVIRVIDGPLANVRGQRPEDLGYQGAAVALQKAGRGGPRSGQLRGNGPYVRERSGHFRKVALLPGRIGGPRPDRGAGSPTACSPGSTTFRRCCCGPAASSAPGVCASTATSSRRRRCRPSWPASSRGGPSPGAA